MEYINRDYLFWYDAKIVYDYVYNFLAEKFPNTSDLIVHNINRIDMVVMTQSDKIPIEIQSTPLSPSLAHFEDRIRRQIEENINTYEKCWFFFDSELYRYIVDGVRRNASIGSNLVKKIFKR